MVYSSTSAAIGGAAVTISLVPLIDVAYGISTAPLMVTAMGVVGLLSGAFTIFFSLEEERKLRKGTSSVANHSSAPEDE